MKLQIHTPLGQRSAVAKITVRVAELLSISHDVVLVSPSSTRQQDTQLQVSKRPLGSAYFPIYVIADHAWFGHVLKASRRAPGIVILHDISLFSLASSAFDLDVLGSHIAQRHGRDVGDAFSRWRALPNEGPELMRLRETAPCTELATASSLGLVTHSEFAAERVTAQSLGPTTTIPLPEVLGEGEATISSQVAAIRSQYDRVLVSVGHVNRNRSIEELIVAISTSASLHGRTALILAGACDEAYMQELRRLAERQETPVRVLFTRSLSDSELRGVLSVADACAALRKPVLEGASASVLDQMASGRPVIVYDHGHFSELPRESVLHVDPDASPRILGEALAAAFDSPVGQVVGQRGREYVRSVHTDANYAERLIEAVEASRATVPLSDMFTQLHSNLNRLGVGTIELARRPLLVSGDSLFSRGRELPGLPPPLASIHPRMWTE